MSAVSSALDRCCPGPVTTISILELALSLADVNSEPFRVL
jgi:hypothetical protein